MKSFKVTNNKQLAKIMCISAVTGEKLSWIAINIELKKQINKAMFVTLISFIFT